MEASLKRWRDTLDFGTTAAVSAAEREKNKAVEDRRRSEYRVVAMHEMVNSEPPIYWSTPASHFNGFVE